MNFKPTCFYLMFAGLLSSLLVLECSAQSANSSNSTARQAALLQSRIDAENYNLEVMRTRIAELNAKREALDAQRYDLVKKQDLLGVSGEAFPEIMKMLQSQQVQLSIDLAGLEARREMLDEASNKFRSQQSQAVLEPLKRIMKLEQEAYAELKKQYGKATKSDLLAAEQRVLLAEVQFVEAENALNRPDRIHDDLLETSLQRAEKRARLEEVRRLLGSLTSARRDFDSAQETVGRISRLQSDLTDAHNNLRNAESTLEIYRAKLRDMTEDQNRP